MPVVGIKSRVLGSDFALSGYTRNVSAAWTQDMHEISVLTDTAKQFIIGQDTGTFNLEGLYDVAEHSELAAWKAGAAQPVSYGPSGFAVGSAVWLTNLLESSLELSSSTSGMNEFSLAGQADGIVDMGVSLHDLSAETADGNGTSVDGAAATTGGAVVHLHVTAYSGLDSLVVVVEDSANDSTWAAIDTFSTATGTTSERRVIAGTIRRYVRVRTDVTGTGSATFQASLARR